MNTLHISRTPLFWILLTLASLSGLFFTYHYFPKAFAILNIHITMNRQEALKKAAQLSTVHSWGPEHYQDAAVFESDEQTKNFIELEGGGIGKLNEIIKEKWYSPYYWKVRHFKEHNAHETEIFFTPEGKFYGMHEKLPEELPGAALNSAQALAIARDTLIKSWGIDLNSYIFAESSQEVQPSGRIDHQFVYDRAKEAIKGAPFQLRIGVSGDRLTELKHEIKVPESFKRRYEHMRSANNSIRFAALFIMCILYLGIGCLAGIAFLVSRHSLLWRPALMAGFFVAFLQMLNTLNELPLAWMEYETALSKSSFFIHIFIMLFATVILYTALLTLVFAVAEGLTRYAFGSHPAIWSIWKLENASSFQILGRTIGGYLIIGFDMAFVTAMYALASRTLGWWNPAETLFNPNVLATYVPWFSSISQSILAGSMEECLFRAIPLAGAALLGSRFGKRTLFITIAFLIQAIVFGAAHANYPAQPAYARLIELIIPSFVFGGLYLRYGLLPAILSHTIFDVIWFALPLFISTAPGIFIDKVMVIACSLIPFFIILYARLKIKKFVNAPETAYNKALQPGPKIIEHTPHEQEETVPNFSLHKLRFLALFGCLAIAGWLGLTHFKEDNAPLLITKTEASVIANDALTQKGFSLSQPPWQILSNVSGETDEHDRFVWQENGKEMYVKLLGTYLPAASWKIRFAQFEGDIAERSEEFIARIDGKGEVLELAHQFPESRAGDSLTEKEARKKTHEILKTDFNLNPNDLQEISAISHKHPARLDWTFIFKDPSIYLKENGEARIKISLAGSQLSEAERSVFIPEQWQRNEKQYQTIVSIISMICRLFILFALALLIFLVIKHWRKFVFSPTIFFVFALLLGLKATLQAMNIWPIIISYFKTSEPYGYQALRSMGWLLLQIISQALYFGAGAALGSAKLSKVHAPRSLIIFIGMCTGLILSSCRSIALLVAPSIKPLWADYTYAGSIIPSIGFALSFFTSFAASTVTILLLTRFTDLITDRWHSRRALGFVSLILITFGINGLTIEGIGAWLLTSTLEGVSLASIYYLIVRHIRSAIPIAIATTTVLSISQQMAFHAYPGAVLGSFFAIGFITILALWWADSL